MRTTYEPQMTMREALARYFDVNQFGADGGYNDAWVDFKLGPVPFPFPNTPARVRALRYHDLHHILTDYDTDIRGELEISAWELGAGCRDFTAAWVLNLGGVAAGLFVAPGRVFRAFVRGCRTESLYGKDYERLLASRVAEARREAGADQPPARATAGDLGLFALTVLIGLIVGLTLLAVLTPLLPFGLVTQAMRRRSLQRLGSANGTDGTRAASASAAPPRA
jgi:hypothetical protein